MSAAPDTARRGIMLVVSSPSGAGKTTLTRNLLAQEQNISLSISVTTRARRPSEIDGVHYHFIAMPEFIAMRDGGGLLEWAEVHGNCYGTPRKPVEAALAAGHDMLFDIDWQGTRQLYQSMRQDIVSVFVLPPSAAELKTRLERRAEDSADIIARRCAMRSRKSRTGPSTTMCSSTTISTGASRRCARYWRTAGARAHSAPISRTSSQSC